MYQNYIKHFPTRKSIFNIAVTLSLFITLTRGKIVWKLLIFKSMQLYLYNLPKIYILNLYLIICVPFMSVNVHNLLIAIILRKFHCQARTPFWASDDFVIINYHLKVRFSILRNSYFHCIPVSTVISSLFFK